MTNKVSGKFDSVREFISSKIYKISTNVTCKVDNSESGNKCSLPKSKSSLTSQDKSHTQICEEKILATVFQIQQSAICKISSNWTQIIHVCNPAGVKLN